MFDELTEKFQNVFKSLQGKQVLTEENIDGAIREVKRALIDADVSLKAIKTFTTRIKEKALGEKILKGVTAKDQFIKIIDDEIISLLGNEQKELNLTSIPSVILMLGLQGAGKTTTCAKLANHLKKKGKNPLLVGLDLRRPAAIEQLEILGKQINVPVYKDVRALRATPQLVQNAIEFAKENNFDVVILDSAGRLQIDTEMMAELLLIDRTIQPVEKLLVIDSMIGQEAANIASAFDTQIGITGIILTKLDGDSRGGAALSVVEETKKPIKLAGVGEKLDDLQEFHPDRMASRILGMGDILTLVEQAQEKVKEDEAKELERKMMEDFNFETYLQMQNMMGKMGDFSSVFNIMGIGGMLNKAGINMNKETQEKMLRENEIKMKKYKALIQSMTKEEKHKPDLLNQNRKIRISKGAGLKMGDADKLVSEFRQMKKLMDTFKPFMGMLKSTQGPGMDILKNLMPGTNPNLPKTQSNILKGFKPNKKKN